MNTVKSVIAVAKQQNKDIVIDAVRSSYFLYLLYPNSLRPLTNFKKETSSEVYCRLGLFRPYTLQRFSISHLIYSIRIV